MAQQQLEEQYQLFLKEQEGNEQVRALRHDIQNHLRTIGKMAASNDTGIIRQYIFDACEPAVVPIMSIEEIDSRKIIVATIRPGMAKPYYLRKYGMMDGTWIRIAGVTRKAEPYMIKELQLEGTGASFDTLQVMGEVTPAEIDVLCNRMYQHALARCLSEEQRTE